MILVLCDVCGQPTHGVQTLVRARDRSFVIGGCCERRPFRIPPPLVATVTVRLPSGELAVYELSS